MAELLTVFKSAIARAAGQKAHPTSNNRVRQITLQSAAAYTAANGDTLGTDMVIPAGSLICLGVGLSVNTNAASVTLALGIRDPITKVAISADAIMAAAAITTAATSFIFTGSKTTAGQEYIVPSDAEVYGTFAGATPTANVAIRAEIRYVSP